MQTLEKENKFLFWINWTGLSALVITACYLLSLVAVLIVHGSFGFSMDEWGTPLSNTLMQMAGGAVIALGTGLFQVGMLKQVFRVPGSWVLTLVAGFVLAELITCLILWRYGIIRGQQRFIEGVPLPEAAIFAFAGLITGLLQWPLLSKHFNHSWTWVLTSTLGWGMCIFAIHLLGLITDNPAPLWGFLPGVLFYGAITGATLLWVMEGKESAGNDQ